MDEFAKSNVPSRIAFAVSSETNSKIILDELGAEKLKGAGDMLFKPSGKRMKNLQGFFIADKEIDMVISDSINRYGNIQFNKWILNDSKSEVQVTNGSDMNEEQTEKVINLSEIYKPPVVMEKKFSDDMSEEILAYIVSEGKAVKIKIKNHFKLGYERIDRILFEFKEMGILREREKANEPYPCLLSYDEWKEKYIVYMLT